MLVVQWSTTSRRRPTTVVVGTEPFHERTDSHELLCPGVVRVVAPDFNRDHTVPGNRKKVCRIFPALQRWPMRDGLGDDHRDAWSQILLEKGD